MSTSTKVITWSSFILIAALSGFIFFKFFFVLGEGVKAGELNQIVYKGWVWKTYEGRLIQTGFKGANKGSGIQSNEFNFSVVDRDIAERLMRCSGKNVELKYKEYNGMLPWRGMQKYVVTEILSVSEASPELITDIPIMDAGE